jgi:hypothetical protein
MRQKADIHECICGSLNVIYRSKNHDYGDSFAKVRREFPNAVLIRIADKFERLKQLMSGAEQKVKDESIDDTLLDLANYCILELVERQCDKDLEKDPHLQLILKEGLLNESK